MALLIGRKSVLEDRLERDERHRGLRTRGRRRSSGGFLQYHANYPRCKRLVQRPLCYVAERYKGREKGLYFWISFLGKIVWSVDTALAGGLRLLSSFLGRW